MSDYSPLRREDASSAQTKLAEAAARPILFSGPMVRALLAGTKTQTRRLVKGDKPGQPLDWLDAGLLPVFVSDPDNHLCPYGAPGDLLIVREQFSGPHYCSGEPPRDWGHDSEIWYWADGDPEDGEWSKPKPSIHMPRWASRLTLEVTEVRVERLQDISEADAKAEGCERAITLGELIDHQCTTGATYRLGYSALWDQINGDGAWEANPWVWAVSFRVHKQNVDQFLACEGERSEVRANTNNAEGES